MLSDPTDISPKVLRPTRESRDSAERIDYLIGLRAGQSPGNRWKAAQAFGRIQNPVALEALSEALYDEDWRVQRKAIWALGTIGDPRALQPLRQRYREVDEGLQELIRDAEEMIKTRMYGPGSGPGSAASIFQKAEARYPAPSRTRATPQRARTP